MIIVISISTFVFAFLGGMFALRFKDKLHLILGFSAGAIIAVAFFELLPEAIELGSEIYGATTMTAIVAAGFISYLILDRFAIIHSHTHDEHGGYHANRGKLGTISLSLHSFLDGAAIGLAFQVSVEVGTVVAIAVLIHRFFDGINTVSLILKNGGQQKNVMLWLTMNACAPILGIISTQFFSLSEAVLGIILAVFAGFFLYIGASDLLPESHHNHPTKWTTIMTLAGVAVLYLAIRIAGV